MGAFRAEEERDTNRKLGRRAQNKAAARDATNVSTVRGGVDSVTLPVANCSLKGARERQSGSAE